jgi:hypothetical protein
MKAFKKLTAVLWAQHHMRQAIALCDLAMTLPEEQQPNYDTTSGLWTGIAVCYGRAFKHSDGISSLDSKFTTFPSDELRQRHEWLIAMRDHQFAHKDRLWEREKADQIGFKDDLDKIMLIVAEDGETEWEVKSVQYPNVRLSDFKALCELQRERLAKESDAMILHHINSRELEPGTYDLQKDIPES